MNDVVAVPLRRGIRRLWPVFLKLGIAAALIIFLLRQIDVAELKNSLAGASVLLLLAGVALNVCTVMIAGVRWKLLIRALGIPVKWGDLTCIAFIGQFFAMFLPGPLGDDATRMVYIARATGDRAPLALSSVVVDRGIGLAVVLLLAFFVMPWHYAVLVSNPQSAILAMGIIGGGALVAAGLTLFFLLPEAWLHRVALRILRWFPKGKWRQGAGRLFVAYFGHRWVLILVMSAALGTQLLLCMMFWLGGRAVGIGVGPSAWFGFVPVVLAANALPVTIAGLGVREYLIVLFLGVMGGVAGAQALAASLAIFCMMLATNLLGGVTYLAYHLVGHSRNSTATTNISIIK